MENPSIGCEACRDLLPLCADGVASGESNTLVAAHTAACEACAAELARLKTTLPILKKSPKKAMRTVKQKLRAKRILIGVGSALGAAVVLFGLFVFLVNYMIPVKTPPDDLKFDVTDGVFTATSETDALFTSGRMGSFKAQDGSDIFVVIMSMDNPIARKILPALIRTVYPPQEERGYLWNPAHGAHLMFDLKAAVDHDEDGNLVGPGYSLEGRGLWRVYFIQERDYQKRRIVEDPATGKLTEESMQYATLVWEETIA